MIRHISLHNWKAFEHLELDLPQGTSFIVARNGIGKTSLLQALHFGLFGDRRLLASGTAVECAVRGGEGRTAEVQLTVQLDSREWVIAREVPGNLAPRDALPAPSVTVDGERTSENDWNAALATAAGIGLTELRLLAAIGEGGTLSAVERSATDKYNLVHHLSEVLGVSRLQQVAASLRRLAKDAADAANNERLTLRDRPERSSVGEQERLASEREPLQRQVERLAARLAKIEACRAQRAALMAWREAERDLHQAASSILAELRAVLTQHGEVFQGVLQRRVAIPSDAPGDSSGHQIVETVSAIQRDARQLLDEVQAYRDAELRAVGGVEAHLASIDAALQLLSGVSAICPTCRQPLSEEAGERARAEHLRDRTQLLEDQAARQATASRVDLAITALARATAVQLPAATTPPTEAPPDGTDDDDVAAATAVNAELASARARLPQIDASLRVLEADAQQRAADAALSRRLIAQYRRADLASVTADAFDGLADSMCRDRINPLAQLLAKRWSDLWPGRPALSLNLETGELIGQVADTPIALADLSGGERAVAVVLLRLLALQSASSSPVLLLDEPLEHLDPRNRRLLASLLVAATRGGTEIPPRQVLVTTYEESVTRRLDQQVAGHGSHVVYVAARLPEG